MARYPVSVYLSTLGTFHAATNVRTITVSLMDNIANPAPPLRYHATYTSNDNQRYSVLAHVHNLNQAFHNAIQVWNNALPANIQLIISNDHSTSDIAIALINNYTEDYLTSYSNDFMHYINMYHNEYYNAINTSSALGITNHILLDGPVRRAHATIGLFLPGAREAEMVVYEGEEYRNLNYHFNNIDEVHTVFPNYYADNFVTMLIVQELSHAFGISYGSNIWSNFYVAINSVLFTEPQTVFPQSSLGYLINALLANQGTLPLISNNVISLVNLLFNAPVVSQPSNYITNSISRCYDLYPGMGNLYPRSGSESSKQLNSIELQCYLLINHSRTMQISTSGDINRRFKNIDFSFYVKDEQGNKRYQQNFSNTGSDDVMSSYYGNSRYYFPYGYDTVYFEIADTPGSKEIPMTIHNVPNTKDLHTTVMYNAGTRKVDHSIQRPIKDELRDSELSDEQKHMLKGTADHIFGIDLDISIKFTNYDNYLNIRTYNVFMDLYYKAHGELYGENNWQKWRGGIRVADCRYAPTPDIHDDKNYYRPTGQCVITIPRVFLPKGTHEIILVPKIYDLNSYGGFTPSDYPYHIQSLNDYVGGYGIQPEDPSNLTPRIIGVLQHDSIGVTQFKKYRKDYPVVNNETRFCTWPWCPD